VEFYILPGEVVGLAGSIVPVNPTGNAAGRLTLQTKAASFLTINGSMALQRPAFWDWRFTRRPDLADRMDVVAKYVPWKTRPVGRAGSHW